jgi:hypothetical protein
MPLGGPLGPEADAGGVLGLEEPHPFKNIESPIAVAIMASALILCPAFRKSFSPIDFLP